GVATAHLGEMEIADHRRRQALLLENLDAPAEAHDPHPRMGLGKPSAKPLGIAMDAEDAMAASGCWLAFEPERGGDLGKEAGPGKARVGVEQRRLEGALRRLLAIDGEAGAVGSAIRHLTEHAGEQPPEFGLSGWVLDEKSDNAAHSGPPFATGGNSTAFSAAVQE